jgi:hypothetical protein
MLSLTTMCDCVGGRDSCGAVEAHKKGLKGQ